MSHNTIIPFLSRHIGPRDQDVQTMLATLGASSMEEFIKGVVPESIRQKKPLKLSSFSSVYTESEVLALLRERASKNKLTRSFIGTGYYGTIVPGVIQRNILENPSWYTHYTPYQPEISQGRLEALLNYQTMVCDLTGLQVANASLLDEATAAAEAMALSISYYTGKFGDHTPLSFFVAKNCHPQTIAVVQVRAEALGVELIIGDPGSVTLKKGTCGILLQYPDTFGSIHCYADTVKKAHEAGALVTVATDLLALTLITPPGEWGADIAVGSSQRFGVPYGFGGPHAAFFAVKDEFKRLMPGRLIGVSKDNEGNRALRLALQTREQHIRREKATSNICTAQVLLSVMAGMYAAYHGDAGLRAIAKRVHAHACALAQMLSESGVAISKEGFFDTIHITKSKENAATIAQRAEKAGISLRFISDTELTISLDELTQRNDLLDLVEVVTGQKCSSSKSGGKENLPTELLRTTSFLQHEAFQKFHSETEFLRYLKRLETKDLSLATSMIPLGSCTMKLNATVEMIPITWPEFSSLHPFAPAAHSAGYRILFEELERSLSEITGFAKVSLQPNAGSQGEYAGLLVIRAFHRSRGDLNRTVCLIPRSAHGTNPASAVMAGMEVVVVECDSSGNVDLTDLKAKADAHKDRLAALMVTYPSTHGVFEESIKEICSIIHSYGGQVYMDGANLNAQVGLCSPGEIGADVCHINLHKTFCIPHGGGGPGMGPIGVAAHLAPFLPNHPLVEVGHLQGIGPISAAPWGSASILPISWVYIALMGGAGLTRATEIAIVNANYIAKRLDPHYPVLYKGARGRVAHECIIDLRPIKKSSGIEAEDVAKRLMDYGFHAPTVSFPVVGTLMIEPTESESKEELDRFCDAMIAIRAEIREVEDGKADSKNNCLKNAPHTALSVTTGEWTRPYTREKAVFPAPWTRQNKFWPAVGRVDGVYGDRNLICTCAPIESYGK